MERNYKKMFIYGLLAVVFVVFGCTDAKMGKRQELENKLAEQNQKLAALQKSIEEKDAIIMQFYSNRLCNDINRTRRNTESLFRMVEGSGDCGGYCGIGIGNPSSYGGKNWLAITEE